MMQTTVACRLMNSVKLINIQNWLDVYSKEIVRKKVVQKLCDHRSATYCTFTKDSTSTKQTKDLFNGYSETDKNNVAENYQLKEIGEKREDNVVMVKGSTFWDKVDPKVRRKFKEKYTDPLAALNNILSLNNTNCVTTNYKSTVNRNSTIWECIYSLQKPIKFSVVTRGTSKKAALREAAAICLYWLDKNNYIKTDKSSKLEELRRSYMIHIQPEFLSEMTNLINTYNNNIENMMYLTDFTNVCDELLMPYEKENKETETRQINPRLAKEYNDEMKNRLQNRTSKLQLSISHHRKHIIDTIEKNQVVLVKGGTGCGKSTQIPQFILDTFTEQDKATSCNICVTQPRRISAISLAMRVAQERNEDIGDVVGYHVRLQEVLPQQNFGITYCTTGVLLRKLQTNLTLQGISHVILDEVHERSTDIDLLSALLKRILECNKNLKLVLMSANINIDLYQKYFECAVIEIPGNLYPVKQYFLDDIQKYIPSLLNDSNSRNTRPSINWQQIVDVIKWIDKHKPPGAILCFLAGWNDITVVTSMLHEQGSSNMLIIPAHSKLSITEQQKIFENVPYTTRKVILATDIAEASITIDDVIYVVDSAVKKSVQWAPGEYRSSLNLLWISKANINQRKGRAGRVKQGESFHLIPYGQYRGLDMYPTPAILCSSLEEIIMLSKLYTNEVAKKFFMSLIESPSDAMIKQALDDLIRSGVMDEEENLTVLGRRIAHFMIHPKLAKTLVYSSIFQCLGPFLNIVSLYSTNNVLFNHIKDGKLRCREKIQKFHESSDFIGISSVITKCYEKLNANVNEAADFCNTLNISLTSVLKMEEIQKQLLRRLKHHLIVENNDHESLYSSHENSFANCAHLIEGIILSCTGLLAYRTAVRKQNSYVTNFFQSLHNGNVVFSADSVNYKRKNWPTPFVIYMKEVYDQMSNRCVISETNLISPLAVLLFTDSCIHVSDMTVKAMGDDITFASIENKLSSNSCRIYCNKNELKILLQVREILWSLVNYFVHEQGINESEEFQQITLFKGKLLTCLVRMLNASSEDTDASVRETSGSTITE